MKRKIITTISYTLILLIATGAMLMAADVIETEPNNTPGNATPLTNYNTMLGAIDLTVSMSLPGAAVLLRLIKLV